MNGGYVCRMHGGAAPQVKLAAQRRLLAAADPVAARLIEIALDKKTKDADAIAAARDILNRAGLIAPAETRSEERSDGTVLWEEFVQIYRKRVLGETTDTADS